MEVDRHVQRLGALEDRPKLLVVVEPAVGQTVDHRALKPQLGHGAFKFVGGGTGVRGGQRGETGEAVGMGADSLMQMVVGDASEANRAGRVSHLLHGRSGVGDHLDVDAGLVHLLDSPGSQVFQTLHHRWRPVGVERAVGGADFGMLEVLFQGDDQGFCRH